MATRREIREAWDEHEQAPGFIEADMVVHGGPTLAGEVARTLTATDVFTGWTEHVAVRNGAHRWVLAAMDEVVARLPFPLVGLDTDNGGNSSTTPPNSNSSTPSTPSSGSA